MGLLEEIREQPDVIARTTTVNAEPAQRVAGLAAGCTHAVIAARGTSDNAGRYAQYVWGTRNGLSVGLTTPSLFSVYDRPPRLEGALVVGISQSGESPDIVSVLKIVPERMSASNLRAYIEHLKDNRQRATRYEIAYWSKLLYPVAALAMMVLAIPFALASNRAGGVGVRILFGILIGMGFYNAGKLFSHMGLLNDWPALLAAGMPVLIVGLAASLGLRYAEAR